MKPYFLASICKNGILGGGLIAEESALHYRTNKSTVPPEIRHIIMPYDHILSACPGWLLCFPTLSLTMKDGAQWKYVVFGRRRLMKLLRQRVPGLGKG